MHVYSPIAYSLGVSIVYLQYIPTDMGSLSFRADNWLLKKEHPNSHRKRAPPLAESTDLHNPARSLKITCPSQSCLRQIEKLIIGHTDVFQRFNGQLYTLISANFLHQTNHTVVWSSGMTSRCGWRTPSCPDPDPRQPGFEYVLFHIGGPETLLTCLQFPVPPI